MDPVEKNIALRVEHLIDSMEKLLCGSDVKKISTARLAGAFKQQGNEAVIAHTIRALDPVVEEIIELAKSLTFEEFLTLYPDNGLIMLLLMARSEEAVNERIKTVVSNRQAEIAKNKRPSRTHPEKKNVRQYWAEWQKKSDLYSSKADFIRDMLEKTGINRTQTIHGWIREFERVRLTG